jgi:hypothetical protein
MAALLARGHASWSAMMSRRYTRSGQHGDNAPEALRQMRDRKTTKDTMSRCSTFAATIMFRDALTMLGRSQVGSRDFVVVRFASRVADLTAGTQVLSHGRVRNTWQYRMGAGCTLCGSAAAVHKSTRGRLTSVTTSARCRKTRDLG